MKKIAAGFAVLAAAGFTGLSMAPASAAPFPNCDVAEAAGVYNIQRGDSRYGAHLDREGDGVGCENSAYPLTPVDTAPGYVPPVTPPATSPDAPRAQSGVFANCTEARAAGAVNIPAGDPRYGLHLDRDRDGFGCDASGDDDGVRADGVVVVPRGGNTGTDQYDQMGRVPVGGADTGVTAQEDTTEGGLALGGAALAAAGAAVAARRRWTARG